MRNFKVLNQLLAAQSMLHVFPDAVWMGEFLARALRDVPGVSACSLALRGETQEIGDPCPRALELLQYLNSLTADREFSTIDIQTDEYFEVLPLQTVKRSFGYVFLDLNSQEDFAPFKPAVRNFANMVAVHLENSWQNKKVHMYQEHLQDLVIERTRELESEVVERRRAQEELQRSKQQYFDLIETAQDLIWQTDPQGRFNFLNPAWEEVLGYPVDAMLGKLFTDFMDPRQAEKDFAIFSHILLGNSISKYETVYRASDGSIVTLIFNAKQYVDEEGRVLGARGSAYDISARKVAEEQILQARNLLEQRVHERTAQLEDANIQLERAARMKDEFLASMSHELRTPLTGILGLSEVLQMETAGHLNEKQKTFISHIHASGRHLLELINDILDLSKLEAGKIVLNPTRFSLGETCQGCLQMIAALADDKKLKRTISIQPAVVMLVADERRVKQIIINMLSNAIKFTPEGGSFGIEVVGSQAEKNICITVWDTGIGIKEEDQARLFQPFIQLDARLARQYAGTGLGLALIRRLAELHQGSVCVESKAGQGSRFCVSLPWIE